MRLIDADRLKNDPYMKEFYQQLAIDNAPTVEEVTGEWIYNIPKDSPYYTECSVCGFVLENMFCGENEVQYYEEGTNYCPHCGSRNIEVANDK